MPHIQHHTAMQHLIHAYNFVAPSGKEQQALIAAVRESELAGDSHEATLLLVITAFDDGLRHGNWILPSKV